MARGIRLEVGNDLVSADMAFRIVANVWATWQVEGPIRSHQGEAVPSLPPRLSHRVTFQDDVVDADGQQLSTHRQSSLATTDHNSRSPHDRNLYVARNDGDSLGVTDDRDRERPCGRGVRACGLSSRPSECHEPGVIRCTSTLLPTQPS